MNSKIDTQLERMKYLMEFKNTTPKTDTKAGIEYHIDAANGTTYGIIRENNMYYIKTTTPDKATIKESYEYMGGYNYRNEHGYKSFNEATKHLELELMAVNESLGKHEDVSVLLNPNKGKEDLQTLSEAARVELDRMHRIMEHSEKIGKYNINENIDAKNTGDPESKDNASPKDTPKNCAPFSKKTEASLDKDPKFSATVKSATPDNKEVKVSDSDMTSDKMKKGNRGDEGYKDTKDDLEGDSVAAQHPSGGKVVKESVMEGDIDVNDFEEEPVDEPMDTDLAGFDGTEIEPHVDDVPVDEPEIGDLTDDDFAVGDPEGMEDGEVPDLGGLLKEFGFGENNATAQDGTPLYSADGEKNFIPNGKDNIWGVPSLEEDAENGGEDILDGNPSTLAGDAGKGENNVAGEETMDKIDEETEPAKPEGAGKKQSKIVGPDKVMDGPHGGLDTQTWDKLQESIDKITNTICEQLKPKKKETLNEAIDRIVAEEVTKLNVWGKHPRYQKPAFQTPDDHEVSKNGAKDWNDDSTKGSAPYGKKIGSSAPFDQKVDMLTDAVVNMIKENYGLKKK